MSFFEFLIARNVSFSLIYLSDLFTFIEFKLMIQERKASFVQISLEKIQRQLFITSNCVSWVIVVRSKH